MIIVVDANIVIGALLGSRGKLTILTSQNHQFHVPTMIIDEILKYKADICAKSGQSLDEFEMDLDALFKFFTEIDPVEYSPYFDEAYGAISRRDSKDADYLACALFVNAEFIWSDDKDLKSQDLIPVRSTGEFIESGRRP